MANYTIEARSLDILGAASHDFWVLRNSDTGEPIAELNGLATVRKDFDILGFTSVYIASAGTKVLDDGTGKSGASASSPDGAIAESGMSSGWYVIPHSASSMRATCYSVKLFIIGCFCSIMLTACMYPVKHDDFSVLGNDVFSNLIRNSSVMPMNPITRTTPDHGVAKLEPQTMTTLSHEIFLGRKSAEIIEIFKQAQGHCDSNQQMNLLICDVVRQWQLKNVGASTDTSEWEKPTARLLFRFTLSESHVVTDLEVKIISLTKFN